MGEEQVSHTVSFRTENRLSECVYRLRPNGGVGRGQQGCDEIRRLRPFEAPYGPHRKPLNIGIGGAKALLERLEPLGGRRPGVLGVDDRSTQIDVTAVSAPEEREGHGGDE